MPICCLQGWTCVPVFAPTMAAQMKDACLALSHDTQLLHLEHHQKSWTWSTQLQLLMHSSSCSAVISQFGVSSGIQCCDRCVTQHTLVVCALWQAANDPIAPAKAIPRQAMQDNPDCILVVTPCGGHLGWVSGPGAPLGQLLPFPLFPLVVVSSPDVPLAHLCNPCRNHANCTSLCCCGIAKLWCFILLLLRPT